MTEETSSDAAVTDEALNQAVAEASEEAQEEQEAQEKIQEEVQDEEGLPVDHKERSDLGRKIAAMHRRQDDFNERMDRLLGLVETTVKSTNRPTEPEIDPDEPLTYEQLNQVLDQREQSAKKQRADYDKQYTASIGKLSMDLNDDEYEAIIAEMQNITYVPTNNPAVDAEINFSKAERAYLRKQLAGSVEKPNPLKGNKPRSALGTATNQTSVANDEKLPKLDAAGESYLNFVSREDGQDKALELHKSLK